MLVLPIAICNRDIFSCHWFYLEIELRLLDLLKWHITTFKNSKEHSLYFTITSFHCTKCGDPLNIYLLLVTVGHWKTGFLSRAFCSLGCVLSCVTGDVSYCLWADLIVYSMQIAKSYSILDNDFLLNKWLNKSAHFKRLRWKLIKHILLHTS